MIAIRSGTEKVLVNTTMNIQRLTCRIDELNWVLPDLE
jgi:hypothetical protein